MRDTDTRSSQHAVYFTRLTWACVTRVVCLGVCVLLNPPETPITSHYRQLASARLTTLTGFPIGLPG